MSVAFPEFFLDLLSSKCFSGHDGVCHVVVGVVGVLYPAVLFGFLVVDGSGEGCEDGVDGEVGVDVGGEVSELVDGFVGVFSVADDKHGV